MKKLWTSPEDSKPQKNFASHVNRAGMRDEHLDEFYDDKTLNLSASRRDFLKLFGFTIIINKNDILLTPSKNDTLSIIRQEISRLFQLPLCVKFLLNKAILCGFVYVPLRCVFIRDCILTVLVD